jgi:hypothetical protein
MSNYEASRPVTELRDGLREQYLEQVERASKAALAVPSDPRWSYRLRLMKAIVAAAPDLSERQLHAATRNDFELSRKVNVLHNFLVDIRLGKLAETVEQCAQDEARRGHVILDQ